MKIPINIETLIKENLQQEQAELVLTELIESLKLEAISPPLVNEGRTEGDWNAILPDLTDDVRPFEQLTFDVINQMLKSSPVRFALEMKRSQVVSVFRNERSWTVKSPDEELAEVARANLIQILPKMALDFSWSSLVYGSSFQELVWEYKTKKELGIAEEDSKESKKWVVAKIPNAVDPETVTKIKRTKEGHFNGFVQLTKMAKEIFVEKDSALVIPYNEKFRNLWGESFLKPMYPIWFWYEVVLRSMVRYMERVGTPVTVVKAPSRSTIIRPGTKTKIDGITWGMEIASNVSRSNAAVIPSDTDESGKPLWEIDYLSSSEASQPFLDILELLTQMILRAGLSADRALSQSSGGVGSYNIGEIHKEATALHNEMILIQWVHYLNTYFLPHYSMYNVGQEGPPIIIVTEGLDPRDRENLTALLGVSANIDSFKEASNIIDWKVLFAENNIPTITEEEADELKNKMKEESLANQEEQMKMQSKFGMNTPGNKPVGARPGNTTKPPTPKPGAKLEDDDIFDLELQQEALEDDTQDFFREDREESTLEDYALNEATRSDRQKVALAVVETAVQLFNPYHDKLGRFTNAGAYRDFGTVSDNGRVYDVDRLVQLSATKPTTKINIGEVIYKSDNDELDVDRVNKSDPRVPVIAYRNSNLNKIVILDGSHRVQKAINNKQETISAKLLDEDELYKAQLEDNIFLFNPYHDNLGRFTSGSSSSSPLAVGGRQITRGGKDAPFELKGTRYARNAAKIAGLSLATAGILETLDGRDTFPPESRPIVNIAKLSTKVSALGFGGLSAGIYSAIHGRAAFNNAKTFGTEIRREIQYKGVNKKPVFDRVRDVFNAGRKSVGHAGLSALGAAGAITAAMVIYNLPHSVFGIKGKNRVADAVSNAGEKLARFIGENWDENLAEIVYRTLKFEEPKFDLSQLFSNPEVIEGIYTAWLTFDALSQENLPFEELNLDAKEVKEVTKSLTYFIIAHSISEEIELEDSISLFNPYHDNLGRFASKNSAGFSVPENSHNSALLSEGEYTEVYNKASEAQRGLLASPAEYLTRKEGLGPKIARLGLEVGSETAFSWTIASATFSKGSVLGALGTAAVVGALFGSSPTAVTIVGGLIIGAAASAVVTQLFRQYKDSMLHSYIDRYAPKDNEHISFFGNPGKGRWYNERSQMFKTFGSEIGFDVALKAFGPYVGVPGSWTVINNLMELEDKQETNTDEFVAVLGKYASSMIVGHVNSVRTPYQEQLKDFPGLRRKGKNLVMNQSTLEEFALAYQNDTFPQVYVQFGDTSLEIVDESNS